MKPDTTGYWAALTESKELKVFEVSARREVKVLTKTWRTVEQVEESFKIEKWLGQVTPELFGEGE